MRLWHAITLPAAILAFAAARLAAGQGTLHNPPNVYSQGGVLNVTMRADTATYTLFGQTYTNNLYAVNTYPPLYAPPTLRLHPGDSVSLVLNNQMSGGAWTNLHYHGFNVTPVPPGDNVVTTHVQNDSSYTYGFRVPAWHPSGMFWYHPHPHGIAEPQVLGGMSGAIIIEGLLDPYPQWQNIPERVMLLKDFDNPLGDALPPSVGDTFPKLKTINGLSHSSLTVQGNAPEFWRVGNVGADAYFNLRVRGLPEGATPFWIIGRDGNPTVYPVAAGALFIPPSSRLEAIVTLPPGTYTLYSDYVDTGPDGDPNPSVDLVEITATPSTLPAIAPPAPPATPVPPGPPATPPLPIGGLGPLPTNWYQLVPVDTVVFSEDTINNTFFIDGKMYDPSRIDKEVWGGFSQLWLIQNKTKEVHVFHIHQTDFTVITVNGVPQPLNGMVDTVNLPYMQDGKPGEVLVLILFANSLMDGTFVYHCHIMEHEDRGMMANIRVHGAGMSPSPFTP